MDLNGHFGHGKNNNTSSDIPKSLSEIRGEENAPDASREDVQTRTPWYKSTTLHNVIFDIFCFAWLVPIIASLWLNFTEYVIGASVSCAIPGYKDHCNLWRNLQEHTVALDNKDHEVLGFLQLVAKALEVWFTVCAGSLVLDFSMLLLRRRGLPVGYFLTYMEFANVMSPFSFTFWKSIRTPKNLASSVSHRKSKASLWFFAFLALLLCITCNLMGPAVAVLVIPSLGWAEVNSPMEGAFGVMLASNPPKRISNLRSCEEAALIAGNFTCTDYYSSSVDEMSAGLQWRRSLWDNGSTVLEPILADGNVAFSYNSSTWGDIHHVWVPSRQILREMSLDYMEIFNSKSKNTFEEAKRALPDRDLDFDLFNYYRNTLDIEVHREGPSLGTKGFCTTASIIDIELSSTKSVHCYNTTSRSQPGYYYECIRLGSPWKDARVAHSNFSIRETDTTSGRNISVNMYSVGRSFGIPPEKEHCIVDREISDSCDWDRISSLIVRNPRQAALHLNIQFVEYTPTNMVTPNSTVVCQTNSHLTFPSYTMTLTPLEINNTIVKLVVPQGKPPKSIFLHSDWMLAAWSVSRSGTVDGNRLAASNLVASVKSLASIPLPETREDIPPFRKATNVVLDQHRLIYNHALSLIGHTLVNATELGESGTYMERHPQLTSLKKFRVWGYGTDSQSSKLGVAMAIVGCIFVLGRTLARPLFMHSRPSTLDIVIAALRYSGGFGESAGTSSDENVRFRRDTNAEDLTFVLR
ncbi:hypothetical protein BDDG_07345 [Blastomyces dermatitidis ATCC 18188]|uniref:Uncharacterized protein n=1 Tax=Ajellomyces dermatitidis (strain ATCC 18188 / CBS 674.68) TaxID=653446 RepID=F2TMD7_AJEDA|nr:hypothetical protein BDDG_07345 [Blastomyces dermatitidis ATCC 18188]